MKITFHPFTRGNWYGFAGATPFPNGDEPLLATIDWPTGTQASDFWPEAFSESDSVLAEIEETGLFAVIDAEGMQILGSNAFITFEPPETFESAEEAEVYWTSFIFDHLNEPDYQEFVALGGRPDNFSDEEVEAYMTANPKKEM